MKIKQSVINTFNRVGIDYDHLLTLNIPVAVENRFTGERAITSHLIANCILWVYDTSDDYEQGISKVRVSDFDRVRYFILEQDQKAYMTCID